MHTDIFVQTNSHAHVCRGEAVRFFHHHKDEEWFWERYDPEGRKAAKAHRAQLAQQYKEALYNEEIDWTALELPGLIMEVCLSVCLVVCPSDCPLFIL
jgi:hypothetical protein